MSDKNQQNKLTVTEWFIVAVIGLFVFLTAWPKVEKLIWHEEVEPLNGVSSVKKEPSS